MTRLLSGLIVLLFAVLALLAANRNKPLLVEAHVQTKAPDPPILDLCAYSVPRDRTAIHKA